MDNNRLKKCILIMLDGLGDRSFDLFGHQTPLQAANTPFLDHIAAGGANGLYHAAMLGQALPSENAHFVMFGYDMALFPGRGVLEALGAGIPLGPKDVAVLAHFACLHDAEGCLVVDERKPVISSDDVLQLIDEVSGYEANGVKIRFVQTGGIFGIISLSGDVAPYFTDSDPFVDGSALIEISPWSRYRNDPLSENAAYALKQYLVWVYGRLKDHPVNRFRIGNNMKPVNGFVTQRAGQLKEVRPFTDSYGLRGLSIASGIVYLGLGRYIGMDTRKVYDNTDPGDDLAERLGLAIEGLADYDFIHVHTKAPDDAGHTKDPEFKLKVIESLDKGLGKAIGPLMDDPELLIIITADHSTPSSGPLIHSGESVPMTFYGRGVRRDSVMRFNEIDAAMGALGQIRGRELMYMILDHLDMSKLHGIMDTPDDQPYWPGRYRPFMLDTAPKIST